MWGGAGTLKKKPPTYQRRAPLRLPLVPRNGCGRPGRAPERFLPLDITSLLLHVIFDARFLLRTRKVNANNSAALTGRSTPLIMFSVNSAPSMMRQAV